MYCVKCGTKVSDGDKFCSKCGNLQKEEIIPTQNVTNSEPVNATQTDDNSLANTLCTISLCLYFGASRVLALLPGILAFLGPLCWIGAYVLMIIARVKCPKSTYAKVVMWIYIALFIVEILFWVLIFAACGACIVAANN